MDVGLRTLRLGVDTHAITSHFALPLLIKTPGGLVVEVTDGTADYNAANYRVSFFYDLAKAAVLRMAFALAHELAAYSATAVSLTPGWLRSEAMLDAYGVTNRTGVTRPRGRRISLSPRVQRSSVGGRGARAGPRRCALERAVAVERTPGEIYGFTDLMAASLGGWRYVPEGQTRVARRRNRLQINLLAAGFFEIMERAERGMPRWA